MQTAVNERKTATPGIHAIWIRVAAGLLAAALVATLLLSNAIRIRIQRMEEANAAAAANNYLLENTEYVGLSAWERIQQVVRQMADQASLESHYEKASIAIAQGENETALYHINECLALVDESSEAYEELKMKQGCLLALLEDYEQAQTVFDEVLRRAPGNADAWLLQAQLLLQKGDVTAAMEHLRRYISCAEETADQLSVMAQLCYGAGEYADALIYGEQALAMAADDAAYGELFRCMGYAALLSGDDRAEKYLTSAIERLTDTDPELFYYRGVLRLAREDYEEALVDFDAAIGLGYGTALAYYNRGVCYLTLEDYERLLADMQKVVELNEDEELTQIAQQLIAELTVGSEQES